MKKKTKHLIINVVTLISSLIVLCIFLADSINFPDHSYFYKPQYFNPYTNTNVINGFVNLSFLTYLFSISAIIFFVLNFIFYIFNKNINLSKFLIIITINELFILLIYPIFQLATNGDWGFWANVPKAKHNLFTNIYIHIIYPALCVLFFVLTKKDLRVKAKDCLKIVYPLLISWYIVVKILGEICYSFRWFPYPIFSTDAIWMALFGTLTNYNVFLAHIILILSLGFLVFLYYLISKIVCFMYNKLLNTNKHQ